jgi:hypothetical protein
MADVPLLKVAGLYTSANEFSATPEGALTQADNIVVRSNGVIESRRGQAVQTSYSLSGDSVGAITFFGADAASIRPIVHYGAPSNQGTKLAYDTGSAWSDYSGSYEAPDPTTGRMKFAQAGQNLHFTTSEGPYVLDTLTSTPRKSGVVRAAAPTVSVSGGAGSTMADDTAVAYRVVWGKLDAHGTMHLGEPSGRAVLVNASGSTKDGVLTVPIPSEITTDYFYRIYRSEYSASATTTPGDELYLVYENVPTSAQISTGSITITDITPEILLNDPAYFNPSQPGGILQANGRAPWCMDVTAWSNRVWYANTKLPHRLPIQLLAPLLNNDVVILGNQAYTVEDPPSSGASDAFTVDYTGMTSDAQKIAHAAQQLVYIINLRNKLGAGSQNYGDFHATLTSGAEDPPGKILIEASDYSVARFYLGFKSGGATATNAIQPIPAPAISVTAASTARTLGTTVTVTTASAHGLSAGDSVVVSAGFGGTVFYDGDDPNFPTGIKTVATVGSATTFTYAEGGANATLSGTYYVHKASSSAASNNDQFQNRLYYSKTDEPEAVPYLNYLDVGSRNYPIYRVIGLRDRLFVLKTDGIYVVTGEYPFRVDLLDDTTRILCADSVASVNNAVYFLANQGVVSVSDAGVKIVSRPIERTLLQSEAFTSRTAQTFAVGYETERSYLLWLAAEGDAAASEAYVYNALTNAWTRWPIIRAAAAVNPANDRLYLADETATALRVERKNFNYTDFADEVLYSGQSTLSVSSDHLTFHLPGPGGITAHRR